MAGCDTQATARSAGFFSAASPVALGLALILAALLPAPAAQAGRTGTTPPTLKLPGLDPRAAADLSDNGEGYFGAYQRGQYLAAFGLATTRAGNNEPAAMTMLGFLYEHGEGVPRDIKKAIGWYDLAAKRGDREAQFALSQIYLEGAGVPKDRPKALEYLKQAVAKDQPAALYNLGLLHIEGDLVKHDLARAAELFRRAAEKGNADAQYSLGVMLASGEGVALDKPAAARWFDQAAASGHVDAEVELAITLANGKGVPKDLPGALKWFRKAAYAGNAIAQNRLARMYAYGIGTEVKPVEAGKWHQLAKTAGLSDIGLDSFVASLSDDDHAKIKAAAQSWLDRPTSPRPGQQKAAGTFAQPAPFKPNFDAALAPAGATGSVPASLPVAGGFKPDFSAASQPPAPLFIPSEPTPILRKSTDPAAVAGPDFNVVAPPPPPQPSPAAKTP